MHKEAEKADGDETVDHAKEEENDIRELHMVSSGDERVDEVSLTILIFHIFLICCCFYCYHEHLFEASLLKAGERIQPCVH